MQLILNLKDAPGWGLRKEHAIIFAENGGKTSRSLWKISNALEEVKWFCSHDSKKVQNLYFEEKD